MSGSLVIFLIIPYLILIVLFITGWFRKQKPTHQILSQPFVSIVIPVKNEQENLSLLLYDLFKQEYPNDKYEIIIVDDGSEDATFLIAEKFQSSDNSKVKVIKLAGNGKKAALWAGINFSKGELLLTTDGDCRISSKWISSMVNYYQKYPDRLLIGPVFLKEKEGLLNHFQSLEFLSLIASGAGASGLGNPILCNGANLGGHRSLFLKAEKVYHSGIASGDDIFLLLELKKLKTSAVFVKDNHAVVITGNSANIKQFVNQRTRWTFKSRFYKDWAIILTAIIVLFTNLLLLTGFFYSLAFPQFFKVFLLLYSVKCFVDYFLLFYVAKFFNRKHLLKYFLIHQFLYILYVSFIGIVGHFAGEKWKRNGEIINDYGRINILEEIQKK